MKKDVCAIVLCLLVLFSCGTTRFNQESPCLKALQPGSRLLVPELPEKNPEFYLNGLRKVLDAQQIEITTAAEQEWNFRSSSILDPLDSCNFSALQKLGFTHLLLLRELSNQAGSKYAYYTSQEISWETVMLSYKPTWYDRGNQAEIMLQLVPLNDVKATYSIAAETIISPLIVRRDDEGESHINPTSVESARYKAMVKAAMRMLKNCCKN